MTESSLTDQAENAFLDIHGREVHAFSMEMANVGFHRMADLLAAMLKSEAWRSFKDGLGSYNFLLGEFDYFLSQQGIRREDVMKLPDVKVKADLEAYMDERRTGEADHRRPVLEARRANPQRPGRPIEAYGYTQAEAKALVSATGVQHAGTLHREALGNSVRRFTTRAAGQRNRIRARYRWSSACGGRQCASATLTSRTWSML